MPFDSAVTDSGRSRVLDERRAFRVSHVPEIPEAKDAYRTGIFQLKANSGETLPHCSVVILNYNGRGLLERFLPSVVALDYPDFDVFVVDNASVDDSVSFLRAEYPQVKLVLNSKNYGTAEGSNIGLHATNSEFVLWLSNDMEVDPMLLRRLVETAITSEKVGICTCKMLRITAKGEKLRLIDSVGGDIDVLGFPSARGINTTDKGQLDDPRPVFFSFGGAMLIKRDVVRKAGHYDPTFFTLADDIDLCWRARLAGFEVVVEPRALLYHRVSATLGTVFGRSKKRFMSERNTFRMLVKNYSTVTLMRVLPLYLSLLTMEIGLFVAMKRFAMVRAYFDAICWNLMNFRDTWSQHLLVQSTRAVSDDEIRLMMYPGSFKVRILKDFLKARNGPSWSGYFGEQTTSSGSTSIS